MDDGQGRPESEAGRTSVTASHAAAVHVVSSPRVPPSSNSPRAGQELPAIRTCRARARLPLRGSRAYLFSLHCQLVKSAALSACPQSADFTTRGIFMICP